MRLLIVQPWIRVGGAELLSLHLADELERMGHSVTIAALFVDPRGLPDDLVRRSYRLPARWSQRAFAASRALFFLAGPLVLLGVAARASREIDCLNPHNLPASLITAIVGPLRRIPTVWQVNEVPEPTSAADADAVGRMERYAWRVGAALARWSAGRTTALVVLSHKTRLEVGRRYSRDATVVRAGVDGPAQAPGAAERDPRRARLLFVGKLHPQKDPLRAIRIAALLTTRGWDVHLTLIGDGPQHAVASEAAARQLGSRATLVPRVTDGELRQLYAISDVLVVTADARQSWGLTPFEALACGTPSVIPNHVGAAEVLGPRGAALVVEPSDTAFADAAESLLLDADLRTRILASGRELLRELTWRRFALQCSAVFEDAIARTRSGPRRIRP